VTDARLLTELLAAQHQAGYAYGVLGARLPDSTRSLALQALREHRADRDGLEALLRSRGLPVTGPAVAYAVSVASPAQAVALAVRVEDEVGVLWRDLVAVTDDAALRRLGTSGLVACAVRAVPWRRLAKLPLTVALPGEVPQG
jgi:hypothetical protein